MRVIPGIFTQRWGHQITVSKYLLDAVTEKTVSLTLQAKASWLMHWLRQAGTGTSAKLGPSPCPCTKEWRTIPGLLGVPIFTRIFVLTELPQKVFVSLNTLSVSQLTFSPHSSGRKQFQCVLTLLLLLLTLLLELLAADLLCRLSCVRDPTWRHARVQ